MTREEAIKILSKETSMEKVNELNYYAGFSRDKVVGLIQEAMEMGAEALKKQIPKKVKNIKHRPNGLYGFCSVCNHALLKESYCPRCGNALDWTEPYKEGDT